MYTKTENNVETVVDRDENLPLDLSLHRVKREYGQINHTTTTKEQATQTRTDKRHNLVEAKKRWELTKISVNMKHAIGISDYKLSASSLTFRVDYNNYFSNWRSAKDCLEIPEILTDYMEHIRALYPAAAEYILNHYEDIAYITEYH